MSLHILNKSVSSLGCLFYLHLLEKKGKVEELKKTDAEDSWIRRQSGMSLIPSWVGHLHIWFPVTFILVQRLEVAVSIMY